MRMLILEDNSDRRTEMVSVLRELIPSIEIFLADTAADFAEDLSNRLNGCGLISLDHDLGPSRLIGGIWRDPGDGRDAASELAKHRVCCPVIIHSTNIAGAQSMSLTLKDAGWPVNLVTPYGDLEWVRESWKIQVERNFSA